MKPTITAAIIENAGKVLIALPHDQPPDNRRWEFCTGEVTGNESPEAAMRRAAHERLDINIEISVGQPPFDGNYGDRDVVYRFFIAGIKTGKATPLDYEDIRWLAPAQLREYQFNPTMQQVIDWYLDDQP